jgi:hypothetical protein
MQLCQTEPAGVQIRSECSVRDWTQDEVNAVNAEQCERSVYLDVPKLDSDNLVKEPNFSARMAARGTLFIFLAYCNIRLTRKLNGPAHSVAGSQKYKVNQVRFNNFILPFPRTSLSMRALCSSKRRPSRQLVSR